MDLGAAVGADEVPAVALYDGREDVVVANRALEEVREVLTTRARGDWHIGRHFRDPLDDREAVVEGDTAATPCVRWVMMCESQQWLYSRVRTGGHFVAASLFCVITCCGEDVVQRPDVVRGHSRR